MNKPLRIAIAEDEPELLDDLEETLVSLGHHVIVKARTGEELVEKCLDHFPDLIVTDVKMPDLDGLEAARRIGMRQPVPVVITSAHHDREFIQRALESHVLAYLVKPIDDANLKTSISLAMWRFKEFQALHQQAADLRQTLEDRKIVERAKGILMKRAQLDESAAFSRLQELASNKNMKMVEIAKMLVTADEAFLPTD